jgi:hypothetical protein
MAQGHEELLKWVDTAFPALRDRIAATYAAIYRSMKSADMWGDGLADEMEAGLPPATP